MKKIMNEVQPAYPRIADVTEICRGRCSACNSDADEELNVVFIFYLIDSDNAKFLFRLC